MISQNFTSCWPERTLQSMPEQELQLSVMVPAKIRRAFDTFWIDLQGNQKDHVALALFSYMTLGDQEREAVRRAYRRWSGIEVSGADKLKQEMLEAKRESEGRSARDELSGKARRGNRGQKRIG
jgi:hypothetical protein